MDRVPKPYTFDRVVRIVITLMVIGACLFIINYLREVLIPFVVALILAYIMNPIVNFIQKLVKKRVFAVIISLILFFGFFTLLGFIFIPMIAAEVTKMGELLQQLVTKSDLQQQINNYLPENIASVVEEFIVSQDFSILIDLGKSNNAANFIGKNILPTVTNIFSGTISVVVWIFGLAIVMLYLIFLLLDYNNFVAEWKSLIPPKYKNVVLGVINDFEEAMNNYFRAQALISGIIGVLFAIGFSIIGLPLGIALGLLTGMLNMMPYLHSLSIVPAIFLALVKSLETGSNFWVMLLLVFIVFAVIQFILDGILVPKIMGNATGLNAAVILLSLSIWGKLMGMLGLLIALPLTYLILSYYRRFLAKGSLKMKGPQRHIQKDNNLKYRTFDN